VWGFSAKSPEDLAFGTAVVAEARAEGCLFARKFKEPVLVGAWMAAVMGVDCTEEESHDNADDDGTDENTGDGTAHSGDVDRDNGERHGDKYAIDGMGERSGEGGVSSKKPIDERRLDRQSGFWPPSTSFDRDADRRGDDRGRLETNREDPGGRYRDRNMCSRDRSRSRSRQGGSGRGRTRGHSHDRSYGQSYDRRFG
jgi:hypothetical protein